MSLNFWSLTIKIPTQGGYHVRSKSLPREHHVRLKSLPRGHHVRSKSLPRGHHVRSEFLPREHHVRSKSLPRGHHVRSKSLPREHTYDQNPYPRDITWIKVPTQGTSRRITPIYIWDGMPLNARLCEWGNDGCLATGEGITGKIFRVPGVTEVMGSIPTWNSANRTRKYLYLI